MAARIAGVTLPNEKRIVVGINISGVMNVPYTTELKSETEYSVIDSGSIISPWNTSITENSMNSADAVKIAIHLNIFILYNKAPMKMLTVRTMYKIVQLLRP